MFLTKGRYSILRSLAMVLLCLNFTSCADDQQEELEDLEVSEQGLSGDQGTNGLAQDLPDMDPVSVDNFSSDSGIVDLNSLPPANPEGEGIIPQPPVLPPIQPPKPDLTAGQFQGIKGSPEEVQSYLTAPKRVYYIKSLYAPTFQKPDTNATVVGSMVRGEHILAPSTSTNGWLFVQPGVYLQEMHLAETIVPRFEPQANWRQRSYWKMGH